MAIAVQQIYPIAHLPLVLGVLRVLSQSCDFEAKVKIRVMKNQWFTSLNFPVFGNLRQNPAISKRFL
jgi:hypothetical protein